MTSHASGSGGRLPPGPGQAPLAQTWAWARRPLALLEEGRQRFGSTFTLRFVGGRAYVILSDPEHVRAVFTAPADVLGSGNQGMKPFLGGGSMFVVDGESHRRHRRLVSPSLKGQRLDAHGPKMDELVARSIASWPLDRPFPIVDVLREITLAIIIQVIFGVTEPEREALLTRCVDRMMNGIGARLAFVPFLRVDLGPLSPWGRFLRTRAAVRDVMQAQIDAVRRNPSGRKDVLSALLDDGRTDREPLDDDEIQSELLTLLGAGHETTTAALAWAFQWMLGTPSVLARVVEEAKAGAAKRPDDLPFIGAALAETLRLMPPIPIVPRLALGNFSVGDLDLPQGTYVTPCPYLVHHDDRIHPAAEEFRPERFLESRPGPFEYFPYGGGGRLCIGAAFANYEMAAIVRSILTRVELELVGSARQQVVRHGITLSPSEGTLVRVVRRLA